jgi:hypothetical protein
MCVRLRRVAESWRRVVIMSRQRRSRSRRPRNRIRSSVASSAQCASSTRRIVTLSAEITANSASNTASRPAAKLCSRAPPTSRAMSRIGPRGRGVDSASHRPRSTLAPRCRRRNALTSAVLPKPASPTTDTTEPCPLVARSSALPRMRSALSRSNNGAREFSRTEAITTACPPAIDLRRRSYPSGACGRTGAAAFNASPERPALPTAASPCRRAVRVMLPSRSS